MRRRLSGAALLALVAAQSAGCYAWGNTSATPQQLVEEDAEPVRVTQDGEVQLTLYSLQLRADTLVGYLSRTAIRSTSIPLDYIRKVETRRFSWPRTIGLVAIIAVGIWGIDQLAAGAGTIGSGF